MQQIVPKKCDCAGSDTRFLDDFSHRIFYSAAPGDNDQGVLPTPPCGLIGIIHYVKSTSSSEQWSFYLLPFAAL